MELQRLSLSTKIYQAPIIIMLIKQQNRYILIDTGEGHYGIMYKTCGVEEK